MWRQIARLPGHAALRFPLVLVSIAVLFVLLSASQIRGLVFSDDIEDFLSLDRPQAERSGTSRSTIEIIVGPAENGTIDPETIRDFQRRLLPLHFVDTVLSVFSLYLPSPAGDWHPALPSGHSVQDSLGGLDATAKDIVAPFWNEGTGEFRFLVAVPSRSTGEHATSLSRIRGFARPLRDAGYTVSFGGRSPVQAELPEAIRHDQMKITFSGLLFGFVIAVLLIRAKLVAALMIVPSLFAVLAILVTLALSAIPVSMLTSSAMTLVLIIGIADSIHLYFAWTGAVTSARDARAAMRLALDRTAPAILLTTGTTALCFAAVGLYSPPTLAHLGLVGAVGCVALFFSVTTVWPALLVAIAERRNGWPDPVASGGRAPLRRRFAPLDGVPVLLAVACFVALIAAQPATRTRLVIGDVLPDSTAGIVPATEIDATFGGSTPIRLSVRLRDRAGILDPEGWDAFSKAVEGVTAAGFGPVVSYSRAIDALEEPARRRALEAATRPPLFSILPENDPWMLLMVRDDVNLVEVQTALDGLAADLASAYPVTRIEMTQRIADLVEGADRTILRLFTNALLAAAVALLLLAAAYRSWRVPLVLAIPNLLPILLVATGASVMGGGIGIEVAIALTIAFGIALDDSIHILEHIHREGADGLTRDGVAPALAGVGPVLMVTTGILVAGTSTMLLSDFEVMRRYGVATIVSLIVALACDLFLLPALARKLFRSPGPDDNNGRRATQ